MERAECRAFVEANIDDLMRALGIPHWHLVVKYDHLETPSPDTLCLGHCFRMPDYNRATITLNFDEFDDTDELMRTLVHELLHVVLSPWDVYREAIKQATANEFDHGTESRLFNHFVEQTIVNLQRMWSGSRAYWGKRPESAASAAIESGPPSQIHVEE